MTMSTEMRPEQTSGEDVLRERALARLKKKHDFHIHLTIYVLFNACVVAVWAMTGSGFFWPIFLIAGWGIGVVANAWDAYGRDVPTESQIRHEMDRLNERR
jgi:hypothetical protein